MKQTSMLNNYYKQIVPHICSFFNFKKRIDSSNMNLFDWKQNRQYILQMKEDCSEFAVMIELIKLVFLNLE